MFSVTQIAGSLGPKSRREEEPWYGRMGDYGFWALGGLLFLLLLSFFSFVFPVPIHPLLSELHQGIVYISHRGRGLVVRVPYLRYLIKYTWL